MTKTVFLFDVDNTLLDNDRVAADLREYLQETVGDSAQRYWELFEQLRSEIGYADYLGALQRFRLQNPCEPQMLQVSFFLLDYPFAKLLYPQALEVLREAQKWGTTVVLSDGDVVFQPRKIRCSGLYDAVDGRVLVSLHKEAELGDVARRYPADHYMFVDDKLRILAAVKQQWGDRVTTIFPRQGHYANDPEIVASYPPADVTVERIADLIGWMSESVELVS